MRNVKNPLNPKNSLVWPKVQVKTVGPYRLTFTPTAFGVLNVDFCWMKLSSNAISPITLEYFVIHAIGGKLSAFVDIDVNSIRLNYL